MKVTDFSLKQCLLQQRVSIYLVNAPASHPQAKCLPASTFVVCVLSRQRVNQFLQLVGGDRGKRFLVEPFGNDQGQHF